MSEPAISIIDLSDPRTSTARQPRSLLASVVGAATLASGGDDVRSALACRRRPGRRPCDGRLVLRRQDVPARIAWQCPVCRDRGTLVGWERTPWDLRHQRQQLQHAEDRERRIVHLDHSQFDLMLRELPKDLVLRAGVLGARLEHGPDADEVVLEVQLEALEELAAWISDQVELAHGRRRTRLDRLCARLERASSTQRASSPSPSRAT